MLISLIKKDFGKDFTISMAPIQSSLQYDKLGLGGFLYKELFKKLRRRRRLPSGLKNKIIIKRNYDKMLAYFESILISTFSKSWRNTTSARQHLDLQQLFHLPL